MGLREFWLLLLGESYFFDNGDFPRLPLEHRSEKTAIIGRVEYVVVVLTLAFSEALER